MGIKRSAPSLLLLLALASPAHAGETVTYGYDALGRLVSATAAGGSNANVATAVCYDAAGNRSTYVVTLTGGAACKQASSAATKAGEPAAGAAAADDAAVSDDSAAATVPVAGGDATS